MKQKRIHQLFQLSVAMKGVHGIVEIAGGVALALFSTSAILGALDRVDTHHRLTRSLNGSEHNYYTFFFLSHGALNLALAAGLLREKLWAYPATFAVLALFIAYQLYRFTHVHDPGLIVFSILDLIVIALAWHEYQLLRRHLPTH